MWSARHRATTTDLKFTYSVVVTAQVAPERCERCDAPLCEIRNVTDCRECTQWFVGFLVVIEAREIEFHELEDPTEIIIDRVYGPSDFVISGRLLSFSLSLLRLARLKALEQSDDGRANNPPSNST